MTVALLVMIEDSMLTALTNWFNIDQGTPVIWRRSVGDLVRSLTLNWKFCIASPYVLQDNTLAPAGVAAVN